MLDRFLRGLTRRKPASAGPVDFFHPDDLPAPADGSLAAACGQVARGDTAAAKRILARAKDAVGLALHAALLSRLGEEQAADLAFAAAIAADAREPKDETAAQHFYARGRYYLNQLKPYSAARCLELAHRLAPDSAAPAEMLGIAAYRTGDTAAGERWYAIAIRNTRADRRAALRIKALIDTIPQIYESIGHVQRSRERFEAELDALIAEPPRVDSYTDLLNTTPFYLNYQGRDDHLLEGKLASLLLKACPDLGWTAPHVDDPEPAEGRKLRVAFVSAYLSTHSVGSWYSGAVRLLIGSGRFDISLFTMDAVEPRLADAAARQAMHVRLDKDLPTARAQISQARPDALVYTDVQLHPRIYPLAFARLAPLQCVLVGHPSSTGLPSIDWFVSNVFQDAEGAQAHYSERLARLARIPAWVEKTRPPSREMSREELGMARDTRYYACPMKLQKMHPAFDEAMAAILDRDPHGEIVLFADPDKPLWREQLAARFERSMPAVSDRIVFRPYAARDEFLSVLRQADCVMDTFLFSGGVTTYNAFSIGVPVLTLPGELFRSRMTAGMYAQAGMEDVVARSPGDFVDRALRWASSPDERASVSRRINEGHEALFETADAVELLGDWLETTSRTAGSRPGTP